MIEVFIALITLIAISGLGCVWFLWGFEKGSGKFLGHLINPLFLITLICWIIGFLYSIIFSNGISYMSNNGSEIIVGNIICVIILIVIYGNGFYAGMIYKYLWR